MPFEAPQSAFVGQRLDFKLTEGPGVEARVEHDARLAAGEDRHAFIAVRRGAARLAAPKA